MCVKLLKFSLLLLVVVVGVYLFLFSPLQQYLRHVKYILLEVYAFPLPLFLIHIIFNLLIYKNIKTLMKLFFILFEGFRMFHILLTISVLTIPTIEIAGSVAIVARIFLVSAKHKYLLLNVMSQYLRVILLCDSSSYNSSCSLLNSSSL